MTDHESSAMIDHESNEGLAIATLVGLSGVIAAFALTVALFALRLIVAMEKRLGEFNTVIDGVGFP